MLTAGQRFMQLDNGWKDWKDKSGVVMHRKSVPGTSLKALRIHFAMNATPEDVVASLRDQGLRSKWDTRFMGSEIIEELGKGTAVVRDMIKAPSVISNRDVLVVRHDIRREDGSILLLARSVEREDCPPVKGFVRSHLWMQIFDIQPTKDGKVSVTVAAHMDPKGSIPKWVVNKATGQQFKITLAMMKVVESITSKKL